MNISDLLNLNGGNIEDKVVDSIDEVRDEIGDLTTDLTCKIYSDYLKRSLTNKHVINRVINTSDLGLSYEHLFNIVVDGLDTYYLIDLTYEQFKNSEFVELLFQGYMKVNDKDLNKYLEIVTGDVCNFKLEDIIYKSKKR